MTARNYLIHTEICEECGEMRILFPMIERKDIAPGLYTRAAPNIQCLCEREADEEAERVRQLKLAEIIKKADELYEIDLWTK